MMCSNFLLRWEEHGDEVEKRGGVLIYGTDEEVN